MNKEEPKWVLDYNKSSFNTIVDFAEEQLKAIKRKEFLKKILNELQQSEITSDRHYWTCNLKEFLELKELIK